MDAPSVVIAPPTQIGLQTNRTYIAEVPVVLRGIFANISSGVLYAAPILSPLVGCTKLMFVNLCNAGTGTQTVTLYLVEAGGSEAADRAILIEEPLTAKGTEGCSKRLTFGDGLTLLPGETISGLASAADLVTYRMEILERR